MVFSSTVFLFIFLPICLIVYYNPFIITAERKNPDRGADPKIRTFRNVFLLLASLVFYAWGEPVNILLMIFSIVLAWFLGLKIGSSESGKAAKLWLVFAISVYIIIFFIFKYLTFVSSEIYRWLGLGESPVNIALPIGISFFMFQLMSYLFDVYYKTARPQKNILNLGLYIALFPQLIAGPIVRYNEIEEQILNRRENKEDFSEGLIRFVFGLGKKVLLANYFGLLADNIFALKGGVSAATAWLGAFAYTFQIYFDFSGYSDMAIGLGRIFGFHFSENFNYPYISGSVTEFWRRWHISLSTWFRDYVYIPLGGNRVSKGRWILNMLCVWLLTGIWHGANWTFLIWGLMYFVVLVAERLTGLNRAGRLPVLRHLYTIVIFTVGWVIFRSEDLGRALGFLGNMFGLRGGGGADMTTLYYLKNSWWLLLIGIAAACPLFPKFRDHWLKKGVYIPVIAFNFAVFVLSLISCISSTYSPFIYFNF